MKRKYTCRHIFWGSVISASLVHTHIWQVIWLQFGLRIFSKVLTPSFVAALETIHDISRVLAPLPQKQLTLLPPSRYPDIIPFCITYIFWGSGWHHSEWMIISISWLLGSSLIRLMLYKNILCLGVSGRACPDYPGLLTSNPILCHERNQSLVTEWQ